MKAFKSILLFIIISYILFNLIACNNTNIETQKTNISIAVLKGPTGLGMLNLMEKNNNGEAHNNYEISLYGDPSQIVGMVSNGEVEIAALPTNIAASLYNKMSGGISLMAINTLGVLYVLSDNDDIKTVSDLKNSTIFISGQGATPEYALDYILKRNGLEPGNNVDIQFKSEHSELAALMILSNIKLGMLPEPFVTQVTLKNPNVKVVLDINEEWNKIEDYSDLSMGCLIVTNDFANKNESAVENFLKEYKESVEYTNNNVYDSAKLSNKYDIMPEETARIAIPKCNIVYIDGAEMKEKTNNFLKILYSSNPKSIGGNLPNDQFYY